ncbi:MAG TPA: type II secretion system F family protein [Pyrinomonadaceae bacterium]|nr:type II secretion system F family protein [Pyrinomonadaceae bacterium]
MLLLIAVSTFVCGAFTVMGLYWLAFRTRSVASERLTQLESQTINGPDMVATQETSPVAALAERVAEPLNRLVPPSAAEAAKLRRQLMQAGFRSHDAPLTYRAIQLSSMVLLPLAVAGLYLVMAKPISSAALPILLAFIGGFFIPRFILRHMIKRRKLRIQWGLPDALDLMVVCVEAGLGLNASIVRVSEEIADVHSDMSKEFGLVNLEIRVGRSREEALNNLAERTGVEDLQSLVSMLIQADRFGTSITRAIRVYSDALRTKRRQRAEQAAQMAAVKLLLPLAAFLFPTLFIAILGPAALNLMDAIRNM